MQTAPTRPRARPTLRRCCDRCRRQLLLQRAEGLREAAGRESEATLLRAAVWLEERARASADPALGLEVALHYLVLAEHPEVRAQAGLAALYLERADRWLVRLASRGQEPLGRPRERAN